MDSGIYIIKSISNPLRTYIGSCTTFKGRKKTHISRLKHNKHHSIKLQRHYNKYGLDDLIFELIHECEKSELLKVEQSYLDKGLPYFNTCKTAGNTLGIKFTEAQKNKIRLTSIGRKTMLGKKRSQETKDKLSFLNKGVKNRFYGKKHTQENLQKISINRKGKGGKLILNTNNGIYYDTIRAAADSLNIVSATLSSKLNGLIKNNTNFIFA